MKKLILTTALLLSNSVLADYERLIDATNLGELVSIVKGFGYASLKSDDNGDPEIEARIQGKPYKIILYDCNDEQECNEIVFLAKYSLTQDYDEVFVNEWNRVNRYGTVFIDREKNSLNLAMIVNLNGGISAENFDNTVDIWKNVVGEFQIFLSSKSK